MTDESDDRPAVSPVDPLSDFRSANPEASIEEVGDAYSVNKPWGDPSVALHVSKDNTQLLAALNAVRLPPRFTAILHRDTGDLEFIFSVLKSDDEIRERRFTFSFEGMNYRCEYGDASERLKLVIRAARPQLPATDTGHRNLLTFRVMSRVADATRVPTSFWIRSAGLSEEDLVRLAKHLNFFMQYFDRGTPFIVVHAIDDASESVEVAPPRLFAEFPSVINGRPREPYLLGLWETSMRARDASRKFLYAYQVVEYAAFYHVRDELLRSLRRAFCAPDASSQADLVSRQIMELLVDERQSDEAKLVSVIQQAVEPGRVWPLIEQRADFFAKETSFDGGFSVGPLIKEGWKPDDFRSAWIPKVPDALRRLRNGLVHAREQRAARAIAPSRRNERLLKAWAVLMQTVAAEVMVFGDI